MRSLRRMPKPRMVRRAFEKQGAWPVSCSSTFAALVSLSPLVPTLQLMVCLKNFPTKKKYYQQSERRLGRWSSRLEGWRRTSLWMRVWRIGFCAFLSSTSAILLQAPQVTRRNA